MSSLTPIITAAFTMAALCSSSALDYYVSPAGNDAATGALSSPWKTIQKAANSAKPGDTVHVRAGSYKELVQINVSGTATAPITFRNYGSERVVLDLTGVTPRLDLSAVVRIPSRSYVTIQGWEICNLRTADEARVPVGILIDGAATGIKLLKNKITKIEQNNAVKGNYDANAHGIALYGTSSTAMSNILIDGNELSYLRLGASEALAINGNVSGFTVKNNRIFSCNNIGIDAIGYEGTCPTASLDRARSGLITGNTVYGIDSAYNPAYDGHLTAGGGYRAAAGIYTDGGTGIVIEKNHVYACNIGIELASEHANGKTDYITVRSNVVRHNHQAGLIMGGYDADRGATENCTIFGNTFYANDTLNSWSGQIQLQYYVRKNRFHSNIVWGRADNKLMINHYTDDSGSSSQRSLSPDNVFAYNLYYTVGGTSTNVAFQAIVAGSAKWFTGVAAWQRSGVSSGDAGSTVVNPKFVVAAPSTTATTAHFALAAGSPAINTGLLNAVVAAIDGDVFGDLRLKLGRLDRGADEF